MCSGVPLYFNKFSTVNINDSYNQKKKPTIVLEEKNNHHLFIKFLCYKKVVSHKPTNRGGDGAGHACLSVCLCLFPYIECWSQHPENCRFPINTNQFGRSRDRFPWQPDKRLTLSTAPARRWSSSKRLCLTGPWR